MVSSCFWKLSTVPRKLITVSFSEPISFACLKIKKYRRIQPVTLYLFHQVPYFSKIICCSRCFQALFWKKSLDNISPSNRMARLSRNDVARQTSKQGQYEVIETVIQVVGIKTIERCMLYTLQWMFFLAAWSTQVSHLIYCNIMDHFWLLGGSRNFPDMQKVHKSHPPLVTGVFEILIKSWGE